MKITEIETFMVGAGWKNWLFVKAHTDAGISGILITVSISSDAMSNLLSLLVSRRKK